MSNYNCDQEFKKTVPEKLRHRHPRKEKQLENWLQKFNSSAFSNKIGK